LMVAIGRLPYLHTVRNADVSLGANPRSTVSEVICLASLLRTTLTKWHVFATASADVCPFPPFKDHTLWR
jgi:hypothetical protein